MKNNKLIQDQEKIMNTLHNLVWYRITQDEKYLKAIPDIDAKDFSNYIFYLKYECQEEDDSCIQAIIYLNGKHYEYTHTPQFLNSVWVYEIQDSVVMAKIQEIGGVIDEGFELYNQPIDKEVVEKFRKLWKLNDNEYFDLPF